MDRATGSTEVADVIGSDRSGYVAASEQLGKKKFGLSNNNVGAEGGGGGGWQNKQKLENVPAEVPAGMKYFACL